jgi:hypothetical protein
VGVGVAGLGVSPHAAGAEDQRVEAAPARLPHLVLTHPLRLRVTSRLPIVLRAVSVCVV